MSPCLIRILTPDGRLEPAAYAAESLADALPHEPDGIYTIASTFRRTRVLKLDAHLDRMADSARREGIPLRLDRARLRAALRQMIEEAGHAESRFRITVPRAQPDHVILSLESFTPPGPELVAQGVRCATAPGLARRNPEAKTSDWAHDRRQTALPPGVYEGLLVSADGSILEGFSSNFYAVLDGALRTAGAGVLPGVAQQIVFEVAPAVLPVQRQAARLADIPRMAEAFLTSSSRGVIPIVEIDGQPIGSGAPGPRTQAIRARYDAWVDTHLEEL
ncbi:MAG: aminotransferase class IV [Aggregatilineales bacterium]